MAVLYIVGTPIGNLNDITLRALETLKSVDLILAEDTRHSRQLLAKFAISKPLIAFHEHNEREKAEPLIQRMLSGETMALISDAGTPLISDPGFNLVRLAQDKGVKVVPIPGPSALITALSASGIATDSFLFKGFLPAKQKERQNVLLDLKNASYTLIFYEAPHRLIETFEDLLAVFGEDREAVLARELTKAYETIHRAPLKSLLDWIQETQQAKGECVILVAGMKKENEQGKSKRGVKGIGEETEALEEIVQEIRPLEILKILLEELSVKQSAHLAAKITGLSKRDLYQEALKIKDG